MSSHAATVTAAALASTAAASAASTSAASARRVSDGGFGDVSFASSLLASIHTSADASVRAESGMRAPPPSSQPPAEEPNAIAVINEYVQMYKLPNPWVAIVEEAHIANFEYECRFRGIVTRGQGHSKQEAKKAAAILALKLHAERKQLQQQQQGRFM